MLESKETSTKALEEDIYDKESQIKNVVLPDIHEWSKWWQSKNICALLEAVFCSVLWPIFHSDLYPFLLSNGTSSRLRMSDMLFV